MAHQTYPADLPQPTDDGACDHLDNLRLSNVLLSPCSDPDARVNLSKLSGLALVYCYPRTAGPNETVPAEWNAIPGARGCTPQNCSVRDHFADLQSLGVAHVFGVSTQDSAYQREVQQRLGLKYELLSDADLEFQRSLLLPTFRWNGQELLKRVTLLVEAGRVKKWWYPVFPPDKNIDEVLEYLRGAQAGTDGDGAKHSGDVAS